MKKPKSFKLDKYSTAQAMDEMICDSDGEKLKLPREVGIGSTTFNVKKAKKLIVWLNEFVKWAENEPSRFKK